MNAQLLKAKKNLTLFDVNVLDFGTSIIGVLFICEFFLEFGGENVHTESKLALFGGENQKKSKYQKYSNIEKKSAISLLCI